MNPAILALYHRLPHPARSAVATARGWYLNRWRYNKYTNHLKEEALERDHWSAEQWETWRQERIAYVLHRAATRVPYYRQQWQARRALGDRSSWEVLENWPLLEKDAVRVNPRAFIADDADPKKMFHEHTSGTTGKPLDIWRTHETIAALYAIADARTRVWDGIPENTRWARLGGQLVVPVRQRRPPFWVWNAAMRQLYLSSYHLAPDLIPHYLDALVRYRIRFIAGYPSSVYALAQEAQRLGRRDIQLDAVYTNAEPVLPDHRAAIREAFGCSMRETYGMTETVAAASECASGRMHEWPEIGTFEVLSDGELVCTGLLNADMPLIRYRVGDRGTRPAAGPCPCGRGLPLMGTIEGRKDDVLVTPDGRLIGRLDPVFKGANAIREAQIIQEEIDHIRVLLSPAPGYNHAAETAVVHNLKDRMGDVRVTVELLDVIPRTANGKLRAVICKLSAGQRAAAIRQAPPVFVS